VLPSAFGVVLLPVSLVMGGAVAWFMVRSRRRVSDKQHLKQWLMEVLSEAKAQIDQNIAAQFIEADEQLTLALDDALTRQVAALDAEIKEVDGALKLDATDRANRLRAADDRRAAALALASSGEALLQRIRHTRPITGGVLLPGGVTATTPAGRSIVVGPTIRGTGDHAVVGDSGSVVWDPHPSRTGLTEVKRSYLLEEWPGKEPSRCVCCGN